MFMAIKGNDLECMKNKMTNKYQCIKIKNNFGIFTPLMFLSIIHIIKNMNYRIFRVATCSFLKTWTLSIHIRVVRFMKGKSGQR